MPCATPPPADDPEAVAEFNENNDPLEPTNRAIYAVNDAIDTAVFRPAAVAYSWLPDAFRSHTHNVLETLETPVRLADDMGQGKPRRAGDVLMRGVINATVGVAGVFDVATDWGYPRHDTDGGLMLASWGIGAGPYVYLPILGPSNPRDAVGFGFDVGINPSTWIGRGQFMVIEGYTRLGLAALDQRSRYLDTLDKIKEQALDPYATIRSLSRQNRASKVADNAGDYPHTIPAWFPEPAK